MTHDTIGGKVTDVSPQSITVTAADGFSQTYSVTATTKVDYRSNGAATFPNIGQVKDGDTVRVTGTGTGPYTATTVADRGTTTTSGH